MAEVEVATLDDAALRAWSRELEATRRLVEAQQARAMVEIDRRGLHLHDGHRDVRAWYRATHRWSSTEANRCRRLGGLGRAASEVLEALADGTVGVGQAHVIAQAHANPRVAGAVVELVPQLLRHARHEAAATFEQIVQRWVHLVDQDGSAASAERALAGRSVSLAVNEHGFVLRVVGTAADGADLRAALRERTQVEWEAEWARCVAEHGDDACPAFMSRTGEQRRYDALMSLLVGSTSAIVNLMADVTTFEHGLRQLLGADVPVEARGAPQPRPADLRRWHSGTTDGAFVPPADVVLAAVRGRIRLVVTDERGVVLHMGRLRRLFTGRLREAVLLAATRCTHPGCETPSGDSQADHLQPHSEGGVTSISNGGPACGKHNRWRYAAGARTILDAEGYWRTYRHDGSEIA